MNSTPAPRRIQGGDASNGMRKPQHSTPNLAPMLIELAEKPTARGHELKGHVLSPARYRYGHLLGDLAIAIQPP